MLGTFITGNANIHCSPYILIFQINCFWWGFLNFYSEHRQSVKLFHYGQGGNCLQRLSTDNKSGTSKERVNTKFRFVYNEIQSQISRGQKFHSSARNYE